MGHFFTICITNEFHQADCMSDYNSVKKILKFRRMLQTKWQMVRRMLHVHDARHAKLRMLQGLLKMLIVMHRLLEQTRNRPAFFHWFAYYFTIGLFFFSFWHLSFLNGHAIFLFIFLISILIKISTLFRIKFSFFFNFSRNLYYNFL